MFGLKRRTLAELEVSHVVFDVIAEALQKAGYDHAFVGGMIDMTGIGLTRGDEPGQQQRHRPISKNTAPGAI